MEVSTVKEAGPSSVFGKRKEPHTIIIARGSEIKHVTVRPWTTALIASTLALAAIGYLFGTTYLVLRDDLIGAATARQARMQQSYEDRIAALRAQVDRITSRQLLDQQLVETKVSELLARQSKLSERHDLLGVFDQSGLTTGSTGTSNSKSPPVPPARPDKQAQLEVHDGALAYSAASAPASPFKFWSTGNADKLAKSSADRADRLFVSINQSLRSIEAEQIEKLDTLASNAHAEAEVISGALASAGFNVGAETTTSDVGGPLIPVDAETMFDSKVRGLDEALDKLSALKKEARKLPFASPAPGRDITSRFGVRSDPFLGTAAMHSGMDFRAPTGAPIMAPGAGTVIKAGWGGGYGNMVEIEHAKGFSTRFGHMSRIMVNVGDKVKPGDVIGQVGSTGRSTGPHIHYEVRREGTAIDPIRFIKAGQRITKLLRK